MDDLKSQANTLARKYTSELDHLLRDLAASVVAQLNERFGIRPRYEFIQFKHELPFLKISTSHQELNVEYLRKQL